MRTLNGFLDLIASPTTYFVFLGYESGCAREER